MVRLEGGNHAVDVSTPKVESGCLSQRLLPLLRPESRRANELARDEVRLLNERIILAAHRIEDLRRADV